MFTAPGNKRRYSYVECAGMTTRREAPRLCLAATRGGGERRACSAAAVGHVHRAVCALLQHIGCGVVGAELEANRINACKQSCKYISVHSLGMLLPSRPASLPWPAVFHSTARYSVME